ADLLVSGGAVRAFQEAIRRRAVEREPVAYITGRRAFRRLELAVDRRALIPRPETELLVEAGLGLDASARVLDGGTGCGAVAPARALLAGPDGLAAISALLEQLAPRANVRTVALEVGAGQAPAVEQMVLAAGFARMRLERDLAGIERVVVGEGRR